MKKTELPVLNNISPLNTLVDCFAHELRELDFSGDIHSDYASRVSTSMDNSIYFVIPKLVVFPRSVDDIHKIFSLASKIEYREVKFSPRGGGTATAGHSLCAGVIVDTSRYMNKIREINIKDRYVKVDPGVVLDQLNDALADSGYFFAPNLSPSNRATLGGMVNTDACGKGSRIYGRTSEHILELECILINGDKLTTKKISLDEIKKEENLSEIEKNIYKTVVEHIIEKYDLIEQQFPKLSRHLTGYNLARTYDKQKNQINLNYLVSGSEGTLAFISQITLKLTEKPKAKALFAISYNDFDVALRAARDLLSSQPSAIETVDNNIIELAKNDEIYHKVKHMLEKDSSINLRAVNFVEFIADSKEELDEKSAKLEKILCDKDIKYHLTEDEKEMDSLWDLRKKGVGLLGAMKGYRKPIPFIEDTTVPPENLADYIKDLTAVLDSYGVKYGMFGHVDVGCLHVRPALDMTLQNDSKKVAEITDKVNTLVKKHGGVLCGEHGHGFRSEYVKDYFGKDLYDSLGHIKKSFDPHNQLNPGKITVPSGSEDKLVKVDGPFRGYSDNKVPIKMRQQFSGAYNCNGNSQCLNYNLDTVICPSAKASRNWLYSPKGRSAVIREWLRQVSAQGYSTVGKLDKIGLTKRSKEPNDFSHEVYDSLSKCLGCKACITGCPIKVDIPTMKSQFLANYHSKYRRPTSDYFVKYSESLLRINLNAPKIFNDIFNTHFFKEVLSSTISFIDAPSMSKLNFKHSLKERNAPEFNLKEFDEFTEAEKEKTVCIVQDIYTSVYETRIALTIYDFLTALGFRVYFTPFRINGKPAYVKGFLKYFHKQAKKATKLYNEIASKGIALVGIDPAMTLVYRDEYPKNLGEDVKFKVQMIQEWLVSKLDDIPTAEGLLKREFNLFMHCTEKSLSFESAQYWQKIFKHFGMKTKIANVGCCGMSGSFGHESKHINISKDIYNLSWKDKIKDYGITSSVVTGFSCRCQVKRMEGHTIKHPIEILELNRKKHRKALT